VRFLLAQLHIDSLANKHSIRDLRNALENLPTKLNGVYGEIMERIWSQDEEDVHLAKNILLWVCHSRLELSTAELQHALAVPLGSTTIDEEALIDVDILISVCAGIVTVDQGSNVVRLVHYTAQKYLDDVRNTHFPHGNTTITATCITYLSLARVEHLSNYEFRYGGADLQRLFPLYRYAVQYWGEYARGEGERNVQALILEFLASNQMQISLRYQCRSLVWRHENVPKLCVLALYGLKDMLELTLQNEDVSVSDSASWTALHFAAWQGK